MAIQLEQFRTEILLWLDHQKETSNRQPQKSLLKRRWAQAQEDAFNRVKDYVAAIEIENRSVDTPVAAPGHGHAKGSDHARA